MKVLVVDDSALMRRLVGGALRSEPDMEVEFARDGVEALARIGDFAPHVITLDVNMPRMDGLACLDRIMVERPTPVVMVSSLTEAGADITLEAMAMGAIDFVAKPGGAMSLAMDEFGPILIEKIRAASTARLRATWRLTERVRLRAGGGRPLAVATDPVATGATARLHQRTVAVAPTPRMTTPRMTTPRMTTPRMLAPPMLGRMDSIVLVGTSTGGPPALDVLLSGLPADFPWPIVVAQHMPASFTGPLARRLDGLCALNVMEVTQPTPLSAGSVYIAKGDADIIVGMRAGAPIVMAAPSMAEYRWHPSVDRLVWSAIEHLGAERLIGVLMTGMGSDGAAAMTRLRADGGRTIAEAEETAVIWGMPGELVKAGGADIVLPLASIPAQLLAWSP